LRRERLSSVGGWIAFSALLGLGIWLRCWAIGAQIVSDDEMHSLNALLWDSPWTIFTRFYDADISTPMTLAQMAIGATSGLSEVTARLPMLVAGIATLVVLPWLAWRELGALVALVYMGLLSISPQLVFYSRWGRPYMISTLLAGVAIFSFLRWWRTRERGAGAGYVLASTLAIWFSVPAAPSVAVPLAVGALFALSESSPTARRRSLASIGVLAFALVLLVTLLLAPPLWATPSALVAKAGAGHPDRSTMDLVAQLFAGTADSRLVIAFWSVTVVGAVVGLRRWPAITLLALAAIGVQVVAIVVAAPAYAEASGVFARYASSTLPMLLLCAAMAFGALDRVPIVQPSWLVPAVAAAVSIGLLFARGPLPPLYLAPNGFTNHSRYQSWYSGPGPLSQTKISGFYCALGRQAGAFAILEAPWLYYWAANRFDLYQSVHRKEVYVGFSAPEYSPPYHISHWPFGDRLRFERFANLDTEDGLARAHVRYAVVHKDLAAEMGEFLPGVEPPFRAARVIDSLRERHGEPVFEDVQLVAFRVDGTREPRWSEADTRCPWE